jgi:hypothetical protein
VTRLGDRAGPTFRVTEGNYDIREQQKGSLPTDLVKVLKNLTKSDVPDQERQKTESGKGGSELNS